MYNKPIHLNVAGARDNQTFNDLHWIFRILLAASVQIFPFMVFMSLFIGASFAPQLFVIAIVALAAFLLLELATVAIWQSISLPAVVSLAVAEIIYFTLAHRLPWTAHILFILLLLVCAYRVIQLQITPTIAYENLLSFKIESIALFIWTLLYLLLQSSVPPSSIRGALEETYLSLFVCLVISRAFWMWYLDRLETRTLTTLGGASFVVWVIIVAIVALFGPIVVLLSYAKLFLGFAVLFLPILASILPDHIHLGKRTSTTAQQSGQVKGSHPLASVHTHPTPVYIHVLEWALLTLIVGTVAYVVIRLAHRPPVPGSIGTTAPSEYVRRGWLTNVNEMSFATTTNPERLRYQKWLKKLANNGIDLSRFETPRALASRVANQGIDADEITAHYELIRYGGPLSDEKTK